MKIIFLGTGAAVPTKKRNHSAIGIKYGREVFLFDCGEGTQRQILYTDISPMKINNIFISHLHGDHILGLPGLLQSMSFSGRTDTLSIYGPSGIVSTVENILKVGGGFAINYKIKVYELSTSEPMKILEYDDYEIYSYPVNHSIPSLGYIFKEKKKPQLDLKKAKELGVKIGPDLRKLKEGIPVLSKDGNTIYPEDVLLPPKKGLCIGYSGDTLPVDDFGKFLKCLGCTTLIHESTFDDSRIDNALETMHTTVSDAVRIGKISNCNDLILTHISARYDDEGMEEYIKNVEECSKYVDNLNIIIAEDFMVYDAKSGSNKKDKTNGE